MPILLAEAIERARAEVVDAEAARNLERLEGFALQNALMDDTALATRNSRIVKETGSQ